MKRFKNILLVLNNQGSDKESFRRGYELAVRNEANLSVIEVIHQSKESLDKWDDKIPNHNIKQLMIDDGIANIKRIVGTSKKISVKMDVLIGIPFIEIIRYVMKNDHDLVMMAAEGKGSIKDRLFGTTSLHLMRKCPCPVWIIKPGKSKTYKKVMVAIDPSELTQEKEALNNKIMELGTSMSRIEKSALFITHAWAFFAEATLRGRAGLSPAEVNKASDQIRDDHYRNLQNLIMQHSMDGIAYKVNLIKGDPGKVLSEMAEKENVDLIVMGTLSRSGLAGFFIGNTAEQMIQRVNCSVLTVKPEGFKTPVK